ncbi:autophagy-related protein 5, partial [Nannochloropsis oceanica]
EGGREGGREPRDPCGTAYIEGKDPALISPLPPSIPPSIPPFHPCSGSNVLPLPR